MKSNNLKVKMLDDDELENVSGGKSTGETQSQCPKCGKFFPCSTSKQKTDFIDHKKSCKGNYNEKPQHVYR